MSWLDSYFNTAPTSIAMVGDVIGTTDANTVHSFSGATVPGAPLANQFLAAASPSNMTWRGIVAADLPSLSGDVTNTVSATEVHSIGTNAPSGIIAVHSAELQFDLGLAPIILAATTNTPSGSSLTIRAGSTTAGGLAIGGDLNLSAGSGGSQSGSVNLQISAGTTVLQIQGASGTTVLGVGNRGVQVGTSTSHVGFFGLSPQAKPSITGQLSLVSDPNAKAVITSIVAACKDVAPGLGLWTDNTT